MAELAIGLDTMAALDPVRTELIRLLAVALRLMLHCSRRGDVDVLNRLPKLSRGHLGPRKLDRDDG